jgi:hypothetical protein
MDSSPLPADGDAAGAFVAAVAKAAVAVVLAPALLAGIALAELLRHLGLRFTWALPAALLAGLPLLVAGPVPHGERFAAAALATAEGRAPSIAVVGAGALLWLALTPWVAIAWKLSRDRRDRLHGGAADRRVVGATGPLQMVTRLMRRTRAAAAGPRTEAACCSASMSAASRYGWRCRRRTR